MNRKGMLTIGIAAIWLAVLGGLAIYAQDSGQSKYAVKVPGGLAFSEFRGYESWQTISISRNERVIAVILGNPEMIEAYQAGIPANGKPVPDGAKMAKVHWTPKQNQFFPDATVLGELVNVDFMVKDSRRFADSGGWDTPSSTTTTSPIRSRPAPRRARRRRAMTPSADSRAIR
jgi:Cytochrome P460